MCELFGVSSARRRAVNTMLGEFFSHGNEHPHGWGLALFDGGNTSLEREPVNACASPYLRERLQTPVEADTVLAHIRLATKGITGYNNTHPFVLSDISGRVFTQAHNGTIFESGRMAAFGADQCGETDSERILLYIVSAMNTRIKQLGRPLTAEERFAVLDGIICEITPDNKVNLLLYDGELLYVHTNFAGSLYQCSIGDGTAFSTRPLGNGRAWEPVPFTRLLAYRKGSLVALGTCHNNEFFEDQEAMRVLLLEIAAVQAAAIPKTAAAVGI